MMFLSPFLQVAMMFLLLSLNTQALNNNNSDQFSGDSRVWDVIVRTCDLPGAGTDAGVYLKVFYEDGRDSEVFFLDNPVRDDFERSERSHFKLRLAQSDIINMGLYWWPSFTLKEHWCADWVLMLNAETETCFEGIFNKWVLHYSNPPTYADKFHRLIYSDCVNPADEKAQRYKFLHFNQQAYD